MNRIGWEKFGRARAQLDAGLDREAVLAEASVDAATWMREEESLLAELADEVERADFVNIDTYRGAYRTTWTELTDLAPSDAPHAAESSSPQSPPPGSPDHAPPAEVQKTSFQLASPIGPWTPTAPPLRSAPGLSQEPALPPSGAPVPAPQLPWPARVPGDYAADQTLPPPELTERAKNPLPFSAHAPAHPEVLVASVPADHPVDATLAASLFVASNPLPFQPAPSQKATPRQDGASPSRSSPASTPAPGAASGPTSRLTLEQYASLCAEFMVFPQHVEAIFRRYGLVSLRERLTLDLAWQERLRRNPTEYHAWQGLYQRYHAYWTDLVRHDGPR